MIWLNLLHSVYQFALCLLSLFAIHRIYLIWLLFRTRKIEPQRWTKAHHFPQVTIQLPIFNEKFVAERLLHAVSELEYPKERLEIQVLDDSTDETFSIIEKRVCELRKAGFSIFHLHRKCRDGYKAGALSSGLEKAKGELLAVFDADFIPTSQFLSQAVPYFEDPSVGMVQARWGHLNGNETLLTRAQSLMLDGHFNIEHLARFKSGLFFNFNGTAGIWRKSTVQSAGGWSQDTLTEDLDLSYRAELAGWKFIYAPHIICPAELPSEVSAFKSQQFRWAKGSSQTLRKLWPKISKSPYSFFVKLEALIHLTSNWAYILLAILSFLFPFAAYSSFLSGHRLNWVDTSIWLFSLSSLFVFFGAAHAEQGRPKSELLVRIPQMMLIGIGMSLNNAIAVLQGMLSKGGCFIRTPKKGSDQNASARYPSVRNSIFWIELIFTFYLCTALLFFISKGVVEALPINILFLSGYFWVTAQTIREQGPVFSFLRIQKI